MQSSSHMIEKTTAKKNRLKLALIFSMAFVPMLLAYYMYTSQAFIPEGRTNNGILLAMPLDFNAIELNGEAGALKNIEGTWKLVTAVSGDCDDQCAKNLYLMRQVNTALHKESHRVKRLLLVDKPLSVKAQELVSGAHPQLTTAQFSLDQYRQWLEEGGVKSVLETPQILVVDPLGNMMMYYHAENTGKDMLTDIKRMLKVSKLG